MMKFLALALLFCGCTPKHDDQTAFNGFGLDSAMFSHFPVSAGYQVVHMAKASPVEERNENSGFYLKTLYKTSKPELERLIAELEKTSIKFESSLDSCLVYINRSNDLLGDTTLTCSSSYPIPVFVEAMVSYFDVENVFLSDDFSYYLIESKHGKFIADDLLSNELPMPHEWDHGISRGVAVSDKRSMALFWIDTW